MLPWASRGTLPPGLEPGSVPGGAVCVRPPPHTPSYTIPGVELKGSAGFPTRRFSAGLGVKSRGRR